MTALHVLSPGAFTTLQDRGRFGAQALGLPVSGALDRDALAIANLLVGNDRGEAALEIRYFGPTLRVEAASLRVALVGAGGRIEVQGHGSVPAGQSVTLPRDAVFSVPAMAESATGCLAVAGGFDAAPRFGSRATYATAGIGGFAGRALAAGDTLPLRSADAPGGPELHLPAAAPAPTGPVRVVLGPQADFFSPEGRATFLSGAYTVSPQANRMAMPLDGPAIAHHKGYNIPSDGIVTGAIQVPGDGRPILLLADRQTTGGYPKIACVISADLPRLARVKPGSALRFEAVEVARAEEIRRDQAAAFERLCRTIAPKGAGQPHSDHLLTENLVSGIFHTDD